MGRTRHDHDSQAVLQVQARAAAAAGALAPPRFDRFILRLQPAAEDAAVRAAAIAAQVLPSGSASRVQTFLADPLEIEVLPALDALPLEPAQAWELARRLAAAPDVIDAEPLFESGMPEDEDRLTEDEALESAGSTDPESQDCEWSVKDINAAGAWAVPGAAASRGAGILIGHPDTGYTLHPEIVPRLRVDLGYDFLANDADPRDELGGATLIPNPGHGTSTSSVIISPPGAPPGRAATWVTGVAPEARLIPFRVARSVVQWSMGNLIQAVQGAVAAGAKVISISLGGLRSAALERVLERAVGQGVIVCAAAGNYVGWVTYPGSSRHVIGVAASNIRRRPWRNSSNGPEVAITAPGQGVFRARTVKKDGREDYDVMPGDGTSYAVAAVAGTAALWRAYHGEKKLRELYRLDQIPLAFRHVLVTGGFRPGQGPWPDGFGPGILDARRVLEAQLPKAEWLVPVPADRGDPWPPDDQFPTHLEGAPEIAAAPAPPLAVPRSLARLLPELPSDQASAALRALLAAAPGAPGGLDATTPEELAFHLSTDAILRQALGAHGRTATPAEVLEGLDPESEATSTPAPARAEAAATRLRALASPGLLAHLAAPAPEAAAEDGAETAADATAEAAGSDSAASGSSTELASRTPVAIKLGLSSTGVEADVQIRLARVPTGVIHLLEDPLVTCVLRCRAGSSAQLRVRVFVEGYSATSVETVELHSEKLEETRHFNVTFFPERLRSVNEVTRATLHVEVDDLSKQPVRVERHSTMPIGLLARTSAYLWILDPITQKKVDLTRYMGAWVTPNAPEVMAVLRQAADRHALGRIAGYQTGAIDVRSQVRAIYETLAASGVHYINSTLALGSPAGAYFQRVRLPREALARRSANCIDGTVLMASLLEGASLRPALVLVPGHAFLAWETQRGSGTWSYLETTELGQGDFEKACRLGESHAVRFQGEAAIHGPDRFRRLPLHELRAAGVTPME